MTYHSRPLGASICHGIHNVAAITKIHTVNSRPRNTNMFPISYYKTASTYYKTEYHFRGFKTMRSRTRIINPRDSIKVDITKAGLYCTGIVRQSNNGELS